VLCPSPAQPHTTLSLGSAHGSRVGARRQDTSATSARRVACRLSRLARPLAARIAQRSCMREPLQPAPPPATLSARSPKSPCPPCPFPVPPGRRRPRRRPQLNIFMMSDLLPLGPRTSGVSMPGAAPPAAGVLEDICGAPPMPPPQFTTFHIG